MCSLLTRNYPLYKSKHTVAIKPSAAMTMNTVEPTNVRKILKLGDL